MAALDHLTDVNAKRGANGVARDERSSRSLASRALDLARAVLPQACALCGASAKHALVCASCDAALPRVVTACPVCALPSAQASTCGACLTHQPPYSATIAALVYAFPVDRLLQALKYGGHLALADWAAEALAAAVASRGASAVDVIVALPLAPARQRERGFNQAYEIARRVGVSLHVPLAEPLVRAASHQPQTMLPWSARARNVRGAFTCVGDVRMLRIAVIDDVMTTGATLAEAAHTLLAAGASRIDAWVVARTLSPAPR
jgi:ComF family protein